jgi:adenosylhomocysteine nucleosidase
MISQLLKPVGDHRLLYVMAADAEYGPHLKARFTPLMIGVGPVEAAIALTDALAGLAAINLLPDLVVSLGSAGSRVLEQGAVCQAGTVSYRDMDASPLGFPKGQTPFMDLPVELELDTPVPGLPIMRLSTGADIVSGTGYDGIDADMVDMETFALKRACMRFEVPLVALRGISDGAADLHHFDDWTQYLHIVDENLAEAVDRLEMALAGED